MLRAAKAGRFPVAPFLAAAGLLYLAGLAYFLSGGGGGGGGRAAGPAAAEGTEGFWSEHFAYTNNVAWEDFSLSLFLRLAAAAAGPGDRRVGRAQILLLLPYFDENRDGWVTKEEYLAFLSKFSPQGAEAGLDGAEDRAFATFAHAVQVAVHTVDRSAASGEGAGEEFSGGCGVLLDRDNKEYLELVASGNLQFGGEQPFTIEAWVQPQLEAKDMAIVSKYNRGKWGQYFLKVAPGGEAFFHREVAPWGQKSKTLLPLGAFSHVAVTYSDKHARIYINGTLEAEQKEQGQDNNPETPVLIGAMYANGAPHDFFHGMIDEVRMWNRARSPQEIKQGMHLSLSGAEKGLAGYWPLDDCTGVKAIDRLGAHHAIVHGGKWVQSPVRFHSYKDAFGCQDTGC